MTELENAKRWAARFEPSLQMMSSIYLGDFKGAKPSVQFYPDGVQYFDPSGYLIHLGFAGVIDLFHPQTFEDFVEAVNYLYGHEEQHLRSTTDSDYSWGIQRGCEVIVEYIASVEEKTKKRFRSESDYRKYVEVDLPKKGIYINWNMLYKLVANQQNALEDGRIERIRQKRFPGFAPLRKKYRYLFWDRESHFPSEKELEKNPANRLRVIENSILTLATCQLYEKGFKETFEGTDIKAEVDALMPQIQAAISSKTCKDMAKNSVKICEQIAPLFYETCKMSDKDAAVKKMLEELLASMIISNHLNGRKKSTEEVDEGSSIDSLFGQSDLTVTLPDEVYDELVKEMEEESGERKGGITIQREHPLPKEEKTEEKDSKGDGANSSSDKNESSESNATSSYNKEESKNSSEGTEGSSEGEDNGSSYESSNEGAESSNGETKNADNKDFEFSGGMYAEGEDDDSSTECDTPNVTENTVTPESKMDSEDGGKGANNTKASGGMGAGGSLEDLKAEMESAAEECRANTFDQVKNVDALNSSRNTSKEAKTKGGKGEAITPNAQTMKDICSDFVENERCYKLTDNLPPVLAQRGKIFQRKCDRFLRSRSTPNLTRLNSGSIDASLITGLTYGDTDIFKKKGTDKKFDGAVYILIDNSGSMSGNKRKMACGAAAIIEEGFSKFMPLKIVAFDSWDRVIHEKVKDWEETSKRSMSWNFYLHGREGGGNEDGYDIMIATRELLSRPEEKKLLVVLSDGAPGNRGLVNKAVRDARKKGIKVCGIYFEEGEIEYDETFASMYERDFICCSHTEIDKNLEKIVKKFSESA